MTDKEYLDFCYDALNRGTPDLLNSQVLWLEGNKISLSRALYFIWHPADVKYKTGQIIFKDGDKKNISPENLELKSKLKKTGLKKELKSLESQQDIANRLRLIEKLNIQTKNKLTQVDTIIASAQVNITKWKELLTERPCLDSYDQEYYDASIEALFHGRHFITKGRVFIRYGGRTFARTRALWNLGHPNDPVLVTEVIHHKDGNKMNDACNNLEKMSAGEHMKLHMEQQHEKRKMTKHM